MTDVSTPTQTPDETGPLDPFGGDSKSFEVTTPVNLVQLRDEIAHRTDVPEIEAVLSVTDFEQPVSDTNPATLFVHPGDIDGRTVRGAIESHEPDPNYGASEVRLGVTPVIEKLAAGETLSQEDIESALRYLLQPPPAPTTSSQG